MSTRFDDKQSLRQTNIPRLPTDELTMLLMKHPYRGMWEQFVQRRRGTGINIRAVATFMAYELSDLANRELAPEHFKDSVRRALSHGVLTDRIINRFIAAFGFTSQESQELWTSVVYHRKLANKVQKVREPLAERTTLSQIITLTCNADGFTESIEIQETFQVNVETLERFKPIVEGQNISLTMISGGEIEEVTAASAYMFKGPHNDVLGVWIKPPYALHKGEVHSYRLFCKLEENEDDGEPYNYFRVGATEEPKYNVTIIMKFAQPVQEIKHCVWDGLDFNEPVIEELLPTGITHYSSHYPFVYRAYCGFQWLLNTAVPPPMKKYPRQ